MIKIFELICNIYDIPSSSAGLSQLGVSEMEASPPPHNGIHYFFLLLQGDDGRIPSDHPKRLGDEDEDRGAGPGDHAQPGQPTRPD